MNTPQPSKNSSRRDALASLGVVLAGLFLYAWAVGRFEPTMLPLLTLFTIVLGIIGLWLGLRSRRRNGRSRWLSLFSIAVAVGCLLVMGIMIANLLVYSRFFR